MSVRQWVGECSINFKNTKKALSELNNIFSVENVSFNNLNEAFEYCGMSIVNDNTVTEITDSLYLEDKLLIALGYFVKKDGYIKIYTEDGNGPGEFLSAYKYSGKLCLLETFYCFKDSTDNNKTVCIDINDYEEGMTIAELLEAKTKYLQKITSNIVLKKFKNPNVIPLYYSDKIIKIPPYLQNKPISCALIVEVVSHGEVYLYWCNNNLKVLDRDALISTSRLIKSFDSNNTINRDDWIKIEYANK